MRCESIVPLGIPHRAMLDTQLRQYDIPEVGMLLGSCMSCTEACIREVMRCESIVPLGIPHRAMLDTQLGQYDIPEVGMLLGSCMSCTEACIREVMRCETIVPLGIPHRAMLDTPLGQYDIPEGTLVAANYVALHMDKEIWGDPENFRPERFIQDGQIKPSLDKSLPFGAGRRLCAGETYARQSMFQVFAAFMQAFHVSAADGWTRQQAPRLPGIITSIPDFWVRVTPRV
ncbi:unnamed protein product [Plutella xylostella]|uniref:(diamondback moth) hypothetical protein n=1 Tax=Plutella xylostella TaxID=51655 RepID=A0A8S4G3E5_PLUXY|nr:unnamed protein product [Plutella xylostella]